MFIIVDSNALCWRSYYAMEGTNLTYEGLETEVIYGFLMSIRFAASNFNCPNFIFTWDHMYNRRKELYPKYKANREIINLTPSQKQSRDVTYKQIAILRDIIIPGLGFTNNFSCKGWEADDIIASIVLNNTLQKFIILSGDEDLYQLLSPHCVMSSDGRKFYTADDLRKEYGIEPVRWSKVKAISGCKSDNVEGIYGVGEKTAIKYLDRKLPRHHKTYLKIASVEGQTIIRRNLRLVKLPLDHPTYYIKFSKHDLFKKDFKRMFTTYGLTSFLDKFDEWIEIFNLY